MRLAAARRLAGETTLPLLEVGERIGFTSPAAFSRFFREHLGQPPREYRAMCARAAGKLVRFPQGERRTDGPHRAEVVAPAGRGVSRGSRG